MSGFDRYSTSYEGEVQKSIDFCGQDVLFFTEVKAHLLLDLCRRRLGDPSRLECLDVGCGVGLTDRFLLPEFGGLTGVDLSEESVAKAAESNPGGRYLPYDGTRLPFENHSFDLVFAINVFHHVPPPQRPGVAGEMARVVKRGGLAVIIEHNPFNPLTRKAVRECSFDADAVLLTHRESRQRLRAAGLKAVEGRYILFFPWRGPLWRRLESRLGWLPFGAQHLAAYTSGEA